MIVSETSCEVPDFATMKTFTWTVSLVDALSHTRSRSVLFEDEFFYLKLQTTDGKVFRVCLVVQKWKEFMKSLYWKVSGILNKGTLVYSDDCIKALEVTEKCKEISLDFNEHHRKSTSEYRCGRACLTLTCELILKHDPAVKQSQTRSSSSYCELKSRSGHLENDLKWLLQDGYASDATFRVMDGPIDFRVHRAILAARSPVFGAMFSHDLSEKNTGVVEIVNCGPEAFRKFLYYLYTSDVEDPSPESAISLYELADKYQVERLKAECLEYLSNNLSVNAFCYIFTLALMHGLRDIIGIAKGFFARNIKYIIISDEWKVFMRENPEEANQLLVQALVVRKEDKDRDRERSRCPSSSSCRHKRKREW